MVEQGVDKHLVDRCSGKNAMLYLCKTQGLLASSAGQPLQPVEKPMPKAAQKKPVKAPAAPAEAQLPFPPLTAPSACCLHQEEEVSRTLSLEQMLEEEGHVDASEDESDSDDEAPEGSIKAALESDLKVLSLCNFQHSTMK
jgi:hypothetical protein